MANNLKQSLLLCFGTNYMCSGAQAQQSTLAKPVEFGKQFMSVYFEDGQAVRVKNV